MFGQTSLVYCVSDPAKIFHGVLTSTCIRNRGDFSIYSSMVDSPTNQIEIKGYYRM